MLVIIPKKLASRYGWTAKFDADLTVISDPKYYIIHSTRTFGLPIIKKWGDRKVLKTLKDDVRDIIVIDGRVSIDEYRNVVRFIPKLSKKIHIALSETTYELLSEHAKRRRIPLSYYIRVYINRLVYDLGMEDEIIEYTAKKLRDKEPKFYG